MATRPAPPAPGGRSRSAASSSTHQSSSQPRQKPRVGQYIIERTLGTGSFGKVKRESSSKRGFLERLLIQLSRYTFGHWTSSRTQAHQSSEDYYSRYECTGEEGDPVPEGLAASAYHQAVRFIPLAHGRGLTSNRYEVITTPTDVIMVMEYAGEELFNYIVAKGKGGVRGSSLARVKILMYV